MHEPNLTTYAKADTVGLMQKGGVGLPIPPKAHRKCGYFGDVNLTVNDLAQTNVTAYRPNMPFIINPLIQALTKATA